MLRTPLKEQRRRAKQLAGVEMQLPCSQAEPFKPCSLLSLLSPKEPWSHIVSQVSKFYFLQGDFWGEGSIQSSLNQISSGWLNLRRARVCTLYHLFLWLPAPINQPRVSVPSETGAAHRQQMRDKGTGWRQVALT